MADKVKFVVPDYEMSAAPLPIEPDSWDPAHPYKAVAPSCGFVSFWSNRPDDTFSADWHRATINTRLVWKATANASTAYVYSGSSFYPVAKGDEIRVNKEDITVVFTRARVVDLEQ